MSVENRASPTLQASLLGMMRAGLVSTMTHPCDVIKIRMQTVDFSKRMRESIFSLYKAEGTLGFYKGYQFRLMKLVPQQAVAWPLMVQVPPFIKKTSQGKVGPLGQQILTALVVSGVNVAMTTPFKNAYTLMNAQLLSIFFRNQHKPEGCLRNTKVQKNFIQFSFSKEGWKGFGSNFRQTAVAYTAFLGYQQLYLDFYRKITKKTQLSLKELSAIGLAVGGSVGMTTISLDMAYTLRLTKDISLLKHLSSPETKKIKTLFRGSIPHFTALGIHNIASVILLDYLRRRQALDS